MKFDTVGTSSCSSTGRDEFLSCSSVMVPARFRANCPRTSRSSSLTNLRPRLLKPGSFVRSENCRINLSVYGPKAPTNHSMTTGMPAANQSPASFRIRRIGVPLTLDGTGERTSSMVKLPSAASATALATGVLETVVPTISDAKTFCPPFVPMPLPPARSRPRPSTWIRPFFVTSALSAPILHGSPAG